ncbi:DUF5686 and carboxypeptidase regulatory-like domain-containing protein [Nonlabens ponticola]|uniref:Carboxypeptidase-like regulatory domain-containing protein n=1 Tax=Nonlabens ponticola TaxID=2496866 RepID=A0A3S9MYB5_9FLAO|nr:DUF5686 and carboxypeptidase regulatory-like domain-containing protein [Nonlabens ponticola]AZQ44138.1 carboxypeptidase-like regulatory domain-containing protein [Nonlabens ponticola]
MKNVYLSLLFLLSLFSQAQLTGVITDEKNEPIAFASIYVKDTYSGTTTNSNGSYALELAQTGTYRIVYQSLGYKTIEKTIEIKSFPYTENVVLIEETMSLDEIVVRSDENPANRVIRAAIENREKNGQKTQSYTANFYSRGLWRMEDVPEKFLGQEVGDLGGSLDSITRSGVIYLSETVSNIAFKAPDNFKEYITASKVSGDDNGFSVNSAEAANFDFYENNIDLNNRIVSPIADYAFSYYKYKLLGTFYDSNNFLINKIEVISRRPKDNTFNGTIYIVEDQWTIYGLELTTTGQNINVPAIKELTFNQEFTYDSSSEQWVKRGQNIVFAFGLFGFKGTGRFIANYTDYDFEPQFDKKTFGRETLAFESKANEKDSLYWRTIRPVPLTLEESNEYVKKDSIAAVRNDPAYKDSVDQVNNKFNLLDPITGYSYRDSNENYSITYDGLIGLDNFRGFNTVQGFVIGTGLRFVKGFDDDYNQVFNVGVDAEYGVSDDRLRYTARAGYRFNRINRRYIGITGGTEARQINNGNPISTLENTLSTLAFERNFAKFYEVDFGRINYYEEIVNGLSLNASVAYERRQPLENTTDQTWFDWDDTSYTRNNPLTLDNSRLAFIRDHEIIKTGITLTWRPGQKYQSYPDQKINIPNEKFPVVSVNYEGGFAASNDGNEFHQLKASIFQTFDMGNVGRSSYWINGGTFLDTGDDISFVDYQHFNGNQLRYKLQALNTYGFGLLDYYDYSTNSDYAQLHLQHDFKGFILGKIPGLNLLNYDLILSGKALVTDRNPYFEVSAGIDNIGFGSFRPFRVDYIRSITSDRNYGAFVVGINFGL